MPRLSTEWDISLVNNICVKYNLMVKHDGCSDELRWKYFFETEKERCIQRVIDFHKPDRFSNGNGERRIKTCKHCMNLTLVKKLCNCKYNPLNARMVTNPHYDVDVDKFPHTNKLKTVCCVTTDSCEENNSGWISFQYYLERAESSPTSRGRLYFLAKASNIDVPNVDKYRRFRKRWNIHSPL